MLDGIEVQAWSVEASARCDDHMRDGAPFVFTQGELVQGASRQLRSKTLKCLHAPRCGRKIARYIQTHGIIPFAISSLDRLQKRVAMLDGRHAHHAAKETALRTHGKKRLRKIDKRMMHVVRWNSRSNAIDIRGGHLAPRVASKTSPRLS